MQSKTSEGDRVRDRIRELACRLWADAEQERRSGQQVQSLEDTWTLQEKLQWRLRWGGIAEGEAAQIVDRVKALPILEPLKDRWHEYAENLSPAFHGALWRQTTAVALKWFDENPTRDDTVLLQRKGFRNDVTP